MATMQNSLSRKMRSKTGKMDEIEEQLEKLGDDVRRLKIEFDIYFNGGTKAPPHQRRASLEARIKRLNW